MTEKKQVHLRIESSVDDGEAVVQDVQGELYLKGESCYFRYEEPEASISMGSTITTVKVTDQQIKVIRHGGLTSEQTFILNKQCIGFYQTPQGDLVLGTMTYDTRIQLDKGLGQVYWSYDLWVNEELAGRYTLTMDIQTIN